MSKKLENDNQTLVEQTSVNENSDKTKVVKTESLNKKNKNLLHDIELELLKEQNNFDKFPKFNVGDTIRVSVLITEGVKKRVQVYEGVVLCFKHGMNRKTFMVRRISSGISIERVFSFHSPYISNIEVIRRAKVRRAKLYFLRGRFGKVARLKELALKKNTNKK